MIRQISPRTGSSSVALMLQQAEACLAQQDWQGAIAHCQHALQTEPNAAAYKLLGTAHLNLSQWQSAEVAYQQALQLQPQWVAVIANLGTVAASQQHWLEALQHYRQALSLQTDVPELAQNVQHLWDQIAASPAALKQVAQALTAEPTQFEAMDQVMLGDRLLQQGQRDAAIAAYRRAVQQNERLAIAHWNLSVALEQAGDREGMIAAYAQALSLQPGWATAEEHCKLGNEFLQRQDWARASLCHQYAIVLQPNLFEAYLGLGLALRKQEQWDVAIAAYQRAIALQPNSWQAHHNLGGVLFDQGDWAGAVERYQSAIQHHANYARSHHGLGSALLRLQHWAEAAAAFDQAIALDPDFAWSHYNRGEALAQLEDEDGAIAAYRQSLQLDPSLSPAERKLMDLLHRRTCRDVETALTYYQKAAEQDPDDLQNYHKLLELQPNNVLWHRQLAESLQRQGKTQAAMVFQQTVQQLGVKTRQAMGVAIAHSHTYDIYQYWLKLNTPNLMGMQRMAEAVTVLQYRPLISIVMPTYNTPESFLRAVIESVRNQIYPYWELCVADDASTQPHVKQILQEYTAKDSRIKVLFRQENGHISLASNSALTLATGEFVALLDHDDVLTPDALYEVVLLLNRHPEADMIYSDEDKMDEVDRCSHPVFKPDWCPDSFLSRMYVCHLGVYRRSLIQAIGGFRQGFEGSQDYDLVLRFTEQTQKIYHIPKVLYHWRMHSDSAAGGTAAKPYAYEAAKRALSAALERRKEPGEVQHVENFLGYYRIRYQIADYKRVSIIIPTRDLAGVLDQCLNSIFAQTTYPNYEVIVVDNGSVELETAEVLKKWSSQQPERFRALHYDVPFNYSHINNYAVSRATGDYLLFLNNDTEVISPDWLDSMVEQAQRPSIGAVGAMLLYPDDTIQHAGVVLGLGGLAAHGHSRFPATEPGYNGQIMSTNNVTAVTGACLMCRREVFEAVNQFDETLVVAYNDIDLCLKIAAQGYHNIYLPHVKLYHHESKSRGYEDTPEKQERLRREADIIKQRWQPILDHDPCYNPNLARDRADYSIRLPTRPVEITTLACTPPAAAFHAYYIDEPATGKHDGLTFLNVRGWVLGKSSPALVVKLLCDSEWIAESPIHCPRPDVSKVFTDLPEAEHSGFHLLVDLFELPSKARLDVQIVLENGDCILLAAFQVCSTAPSLNSP